MLVDNDRYCLPPVEVMTDERYINGVLDMSSNLGELFPGKQKQNLSCAISTFSFCSPQCYWFFDNCNCDIAQEWPEQVCQVL